MIEPHCLREGTEVDFAFKEPHSRNLRSTMLQKRFARKANLKAIVQLTKPQNATCANLANLSLKSISGLHLIFQSGETPNVKLELHVERSAPF